MSHRRVKRYTTNEIEVQLEQLLIYSSLTTSTNEVDLGPIILNIHKSGQQDEYLHALRSFVEEKEKEIEEVCVNNYQVNTINLRASLLRATAVSQGQYSHQPINCRIRTLWDP